MVIDAFSTRTDFDGFILMRAKIDEWSSELNRRRVPRNNKMSSIDFLFAFKLSITQKNTHIFQFKNIPSYQRHASFQ